MPAAGTARVVHTLSDPSTDLVQPKTMPHRAGTRSGAYGDARSQRRGGVTVGCGALLACCVVSFLFGMGVGNTMGTSPSRTRRMRGGGGTAKAAIQKPQKAPADVGVRQGFPEASCAACGWDYGNDWEGTPLTEAQFAAKGTSMMRTRGISPSFHIRVYDREHVSRWAKSQGFYGPLPEVKYLLAGINNGLVVDCGTNMGFVTNFAAALGHRVRAIEAQVDNYKMALSSVTKNGFLDRVRLYHRAAHWQKEPLTLSSNYYLEDGGVKNSGIGTLAEIGGMTQSKVTSNAANVVLETVEPVAVDDIVADDECVHLLKIDVEGCNCHALKSASKLLEANRVQYIVMEIMPMDQCGCDGNTTFSYLFDLNFVPYDAIVKNRKVVEMVQLDEAALLRGEYRDAVFVNTKFQTV